MVFAKRIIFSFFLIFCLQGYGQINYNKLTDKWTPNIHVYKEYFDHQKLDSSFIKKQGIRSITVMETLIKNDTLLYNRPIYVFTYYENGEALHVETNSWSAIGGARRYRDEYGDSTISIQHEHYVYTDSTISDSKFCQTTYYIDDTLSHRIRHYYQFDSLVKTEDLGIYDSRAKERERKKKMVERQTDTTFHNDMFSIGNAIDRKSRQSMCFSPALEMRFENPDPKILKDSLGRVIEVHGSAYFQIGSKHYITPYENAILTYFDSTNLLQSCLVYYQVNRPEFENTALATPQGEKPKFPLCYSDSCLNYQFIATDLVDGIPQNITVINGTSTKQYTTTITYW